MNVLVTGGSGAIGRFVVEELLARGHEVVVLDLQEPPLDHDDLAYVSGSVTDESVVEPLVGDADVAIHLAALVVPACEADPRRALEVNAESTAVVLDAAARGDTRAICASSKAVYGPITGKYGHPEYEPLGEDAPRNPQSIYGVTKLVCEEYCRFYAREHGVEAAAVRFASTYGPGKGEKHGGLAVVSQLIDAAAAGEEFVVEGGDQRDDFVYYPDIGRALADAVETDELTYDAYNVGTGEAATLHAFREVLETECPDADIEIRDGLDFYGHPYPTYARYDVSRARSDLGFEPAYPPAEAVRDYLDRIS